MLVSLHICIAAKMPAMVKECRVFLEGIPFMMNECFLRFILETEDLWFHSQKVALQVARLLDGYKLQGWYKIWKASLAKTDPKWAGYPTLDCIF